MYSIRSASAANYFGANCGPLSEVSVYGMPLRSKSRDDCLSRWVIQKSNETG